MLPEHVKMIKEVFEEENKEKKPIIDEQQMMENELVLSAALKSGDEVEVEYFEEGMRKVTGHIEYIDAIGRTLYLDGIKINLESIITVK